MGVDKQPTWLAAAEVRIMGMVSMSDTLAVGPRWDAMRERSNMPISLSTGLPAVCRGGHYRYDAGWICRTNAALMGSGSITDTAI